MVILCQGQKTIAAQLLRYWNRFLGIIDPHNFMILTKDFILGLCDVYAVTVRSSRISLIW